MKSASDGAWHNYAVTLHTSRTLTPIEKANPD